LGGQDDRLAVSVVAEFVDGRGRASRKEQPARGIDSGSRNGKKGASGDRAATNDRVARTADAAQGRSD
jgi:hypothetical protein